VPPTLPRFPLVTSFGRLSGSIREVWDERARTWSSVGAAPAFAYLRDLAIDEARLEPKVLSKIAIAGRSLSEMTRTDFQLVDG
jgi:hypothetical protein